VAKTKTLCGVKFEIIDDTYAVAHFNDDSRFEKACKTLEDNAEQVNFRSGYYSWAWCLNVKGYHLRADDCRSYGEGCDIILTFKNEN